MGVPLGGKIGGPGDNLFFCACAKPVKGSVPKGGDVDIEKLPCGVALLQKVVKKEIKEKRTSQ